MLVSLHLIYLDGIEQAMRYGGRWGGGDRLSSQLSVVGLVSVLGLMYVISARPGGGGQVAEQAGG